MKILSYILILTLFSCTQENITETIDELPILESKSMNDSGIPIHLLIDSIIEYGSIDAYNHLEIESLDFGAGEFLSTFMIMADKYDSPRASMKVYYEINWMYQIELIENSENGIYHIDNLNTEARKMVVRYLKQSVKLGDYEAKNHLKEYKKLKLIK